ncbi:MAG: hypothetical protein JWR73_1942 [Tardiphaga sp.]|jgi:hypothetical protein|nr:hypothetical protein [Tardiphaga sp.]
MKKTLLLAVVAASLCASSAFAQGVSVGVPGVGGVTVGERGYRDGYRDDYRDRDHRRSYNRYDRDETVVVRRGRDRDYDRGYRRDRGDRVYIERD